MPVRSRTGKRGLNSGSTKPARRTDVDPSFDPDADSALDPAPLADVFISYSREDTHIAERLAEILRAEGFEVWFDRAVRVGLDQWRMSVTALQLKTDIDFGLALREAPTL